MGPHVCVVPRTLAPPDHRGSCARARAGHLSIALRGLRHPLRVNAKSACLLSRACAPTEIGPERRGCCRASPPRPSRPRRARTPCRLGTASLEGLHFPDYLAVRRVWLTRFWPMKGRQSVLWDSGKSSSSRKAGMRAGAEAAAMDPEANRVKDPRAVGQKRPEPLMMPHPLRPARDHLSCSRKRKVTLHSV